MNDHNHPLHHAKASYIVGQRPRGWLAASDPVPSRRASTWSSDWEDTLRASMAFLSGAKSAIRRTIALWDSRIAFDRTPLTRISTPSLSRTSSLSTIPSVSTLRFILLCCLWYASSAMSSNTGKSIMNQFKYPVTLTFIQFAFVAFYCALFMTPAIRFSKVRRPTRAIFMTTLPMGAFQVGGHIFSSMAISRIPVSTVHTIKALSPLFTVAAYALLFRVSYSAKTYISLLPLTIGVMLVCTFDVSASNITGLLCAFGSAMVFVSSNIFFKKVMPSGSNQTSSHKLDKLNLLFYSSSMAFILMVPIWIYCDLPRLMASYEQPEHIAHPGKGHDAPHSVIYYFFLNGSVHFTQNIIAFIILSSTSPVTYSIASLIKRVAVICIAIVWFNQIVHPVQAFGIATTFFGLYMYNQAKGDVEKGESKMRRVEAARDLRLPLATELTGLPTQSSMVETISMTSAHDRSWTNAPPAPQRGYFTIDKIAHEIPQVRNNRENISQHPSQAPLHVKIDSLLPVSSDSSYTASYPSPPASTDSPPSSAVALVSPSQYTNYSWISKRNGTISVVGGEYPSMTEHTRVAVAA